MSREKRNCVRCHGEDLGGQTTPLADQAPAVDGSEVRLYPRNITNDPSGVAAWSDDEIVVAVRNGIDKDRQALCPQMKHYSSDMTDFEVYSMVKYMRSVPPVSRTIPRSVCAPLKTEQ